MDKVQCSSEHGACKCNGEHVRTHAEVNMVHTCATVCMCAVENMTCTRAAVNMVYCLQNVDCTVLGAAGFRFCATIHRISCKERFEECQVNKSVLQNDKSVCLLLRLLEEGCVCAKLWLDYKQNDRCVHNVECVQDNDCLPNLATVNCVQIDNLM